MDTQLVNYTNHHNKIQYHIMKPRGVIYPKIVLCCCTMYFYWFGEIKFISFCKFIYSESLLFVLEDRYIMLHRFTSFVTWEMNYHNLGFSIHQIRLTGPTGYKQVRCLEWVHIINGARLQIGGWQKFSVYIKGRQRLNGWLLNWAAFRICVSYRSIDSK